jgi:hypothetical protein
MTSIIRSGLGQNQPKSEAYGKFKDIKEIKKISEAV